MGQNEENSTRPDSRPRQRTDSRRIVLRQTRTEAQVRRHKGDTGRLHRPR